MQQDFASSGIESIELSLHNAEAIAHAEQQLKSDLDYDIVISFNGLGLDIVDNGQRILEECGKPLYIFLVDHPLYVAMCQQLPSGLEALFHNLRVAEADWGVKAYRGPDAVVVQHLFHSPKADP